MTQGTLRALEAMHGVLGVLAVGALLVPAVLTTARRGRFRVPIVIATLVASFAGAVGLFLYPSYSRLLKRAIYTASRTHGVMFERKEHLAVAAIAFAWAGCLAYVSTPREPESAASRAAFARWCFVFSASIAIVVAVMGTMVASLRTF